MTRLLVLLLSALTCAAGVAPNALHIQSSIPYRFGPVAYYSPNSPLNTLNGAGMSELINLIPLASTNTYLEQGTAASQPLLTNLVNGMSCLLFDGTDDYLKTATFSFMQPETVMGVFAALSFVNASDLFDGNSTGESGTIYMEIGGPPNNSHLFAGTLATTVLIPDTAFHVLSSSFNGVNSYEDIDRAASGALDPGTQSMNGFDIGERADGTQRANMKSSDIFLFDRVLTASEQSCLAQWLGRRNGINVW